MITKIIKSFFKKVGFEIKRDSIVHSQYSRLSRILIDFQINLVYDIGANTGQFGNELRELGYQGKIVSFEPLPDAYDILVANSKKDLLWDIAPRTAIGNENGEIEINIAGNSASSSILEMHNTHLKAAPVTATIGTAKVQIKKIDFFCNDYLKTDSNLFVKVDTQGYEDNILNGGPITIARTKVLQIEISLTELYQGQKLILEMIAKVQNLGFELWGLEPVFVNPETGQMLQVDAVFVRKA